VKTAAVIALRDARSRLTSSNFSEKANLQVNVIEDATHRLGRCVALAIVFLAFAVWRTTLAQAPANRFFGSLGAGFGKSGPAQSLGQDQYSGPTGDVAIGVALSSRGVVGIDVSGWHKDTPFGSSRSVFGTVTLIAFPFGSALDNLFLQGGLGVGNGSFPVHTTASTVTRINVTHPALLVGAGYDIPIACPLWLTPFFQSYGTFGGHRITGNLPSGAHESANAVLFHAGVSLKFYHPGPASSCRQRAPALTQQ
jgi:hypothetical protein